MRRERPEPADLYADGTEISEAAKRKRRDREGARIESVFHGSELREGNKLVEHHARAQQITNDRGIVPGDSDEPGHRRKDPAKDLLETVREPRNVQVRPTHHGVDERKQGKKRDEHRADIQREMQPVKRAARDGPENV